MKILVDTVAPAATGTLPSRAADGMLSDVSAAITWMRQRSLSSPDDFPRKAIEFLHGAGILSAVLPRFLGGQGLGTEPGGAFSCAELLATLGESDLSLARIVEAHINAVRLLVRYGTVAHHQRLRRRLAEGALFALWVTDLSDGSALRGTHIDHEISLTGEKAFCSAAGYATDAVVTVLLGDEYPDLMWVALGAGERIEKNAVGLSGMRGSATGAVNFAGMMVPADSTFGLPGDYLREPDFSAGAWRGSAVAWGGLRALVEAMREQLRARGRDSDPHQRARFGTLLIAAETARHFVFEAARRGESGEADPAAAIAYVNLTRIAVERACLDGMELVQRSLGLQAFVETNSVTHVCRDLAVYLRQPATDEVLSEAAAYGFAHATFP